MATPPTVQRSDAPIGATVRGVDLAAALDDDQVAHLRKLWLDHQVLAFPDQRLTDDDLVRIASAFGPPGDDPYFESIPGHPRIAAIARDADETGPVFAENWHADWTFQEHPPDGTMLYGKVIPPHGGDTEFVDQYAVYESLPDELRAWADETIVVHSARGGYAPDGLYGDDDAPRAMRIRPSASAYATQTHPLVRVHPETGRRTLYGCIGYIIGVDGDDTDEANARLREVYEWQCRPGFRYSHRWEPDMLVMWDNRCVLHRATGGYDGHDRLLHRITIGHRPSQLGTVPNCDGGSVSRR